MTTLVQSLLLTAVRGGWLVLNDLTPKKTLDEIAYFTDALRQRFLHQQDNQVKQQLQTELLSMQSAVTRLVASAASNDVVSAQREKVATLQRLLDIPPLEPDILGGTLGNKFGVPDTFQPAGTHASTSGFVLDQVRSVVARVLEDRTVRDQTLWIQARMVSEQQILTSIKDLMTPQGQAVIEARLSALNAAASALRPSATQQGGAGGGARPSGAGGNPQPGAGGPRPVPPGRREIPIE